MLLHQGLWTVADSCPVPTPSQGTSPKLFEGEKGLPDWKLRRKKLFNVNYSLDTTQGPQTSLYSLAPSFSISLLLCFVFFILRHRTDWLAWCRSVLSPCLFYYHSRNVSTERFLSAPEVAVNSHCGRFCADKSRMVQMTFTLRRSLAGTAIGESCHLAKSSAALYASDLHVSTCSKYNPPGFCGWVLSTLTSRGRNTERRAWER